MRYMVEVTDWGTNVGCQCHAELRQTLPHFKVTTGWVKPGPVTPLVTDFSKLTPSQRAVLALENLHYAQMSLNKAYAERMLEANGGGCTWPESVGATGA